MTVSVLKEGPELRLTCPRCKTVLAYRPRDLREVSERWFGFEVDSYRVLDCPACGAVIRPVRKGGAR